MEALLKDMKFTLESDQKVVDEYGSGPIWQYYQGAAARDEHFIDMLQNRIDAHKNVNQEPLNLFSDLEIEPGQKVGHD